MQQFITAFIDPANIAGHVSYMLLIGSMLMRKMLYLRLLALAAGSFSAAYYFTTGVPVSLFWEMVFSLVNATQLLILFVENRRGNFSAEEQAFAETVLSGVERGHARQLLKFGAWTEVADTHALIHEDTIPALLFYVINGSAKVERHGREIGMVGPGDFLGEMSYLTGKRATATVTALTPLRYLAFERETLRAFLAKNPDVRHALESGFNRNLVDKLVKTNTGIRDKTESADMNGNTRQKAPVT